MWSRPRYQPYYTQQTNESGRPAYFDREGNVMETMLPVHYYAKDIKEPADPRTVPPTWANGDWVALDSIPFESAGELEFMRQVTPNGMHEPLMLVPDELAARAVYKDTHLIQTGGRLDTNFRLPSKKPASEIPPESMANELKGWGQTWYPQRYP